MNNFFTIITFLILSSQVTYAAMSSSSSSSSASSTRMPSSANPSAQGCKPIKVLAKDLQNGGTVYGNGFAISSTEIIINDHTLPAQVGQIQLQLENDTADKVLTTIPAQLSVRDFHTDLALLKVADKLPSNCQLELNPSQNSSVSYSLLGFDRQNLSASQLQVQVHNWQSKKSTVPGLTDTIEIGLLNTLARTNNQGDNKPNNEFGIRESFSGSILVNEQGHVLGLTSQKTPEGSALLIPARIIQNIAFNLRAQASNPLMSPKSNSNLLRPYEIDRSTKSILYKGLKIDLESNKSTNPEKNNSGSGTNPHNSNSGSGTNPHFGPLGQQTPATPTSPYFVSLQDYDLGYAVATVADAKAFQQWSPEIYKVMTMSSVSQIYISSIDKIRIRSNADFLRVISTCTKCEIDGFWIKAKNPKVISDHILKIQANLVSLITFLDENNQSNTEVEKQNEEIYLKGLFEKLNDLNMTLTRIYLDQQQGKINPTLISSTKKSLSNLTRMIFNKYSQTSIMPDKLQDILSDLVVAAQDLGY